MSAFGQDLKDKALLLQLKQHPKSDTFKVNRLNELVANNNLPVKQLDSFNNESLSISRKIKYGVGEGNALVNNAAALNNNGKRQAAFIVLQQADSIAQKLNNKQLQVKVLLGLGRLKAQTSENKQALNYYIRANNIAANLPDKRLLANCQKNISSLYAISLSDFPKALEWGLKSAKTSEDINCKECAAQAWVSLASVYTSIGDHKNALLYYQKGLDANKKLGNITIQANLLNSIGERYRLMGKYPEALKAYNEALTLTTTPYNIELNESNIADVYVRLGNLSAAFEYAFKALKRAQGIDDVEGVSWISGIIGRAYLKQNNADSAIYYGRSGLSAGNKTGTIEFMRDNCEVLANAYAKKGDYSNAYIYRNHYINYRDSMINTQVSNQTNLLQYNYDLAKKQSQITSLNQQKKLQDYFLIGILVVLGLIAITVLVLLKNNRDKQKANDLLSRQKHIIEDQRDQTNKALTNLQLTQKQLIQSEKMASLGELTAGIAHEIQNPLNFVQNFSEVSIELIAEMEEELQKGEKEDVMAMANDIKQNLEKIIHHGKRADGIVKGMLQHSRAGNTIKEPTDINKLADEYLRLAYHGLRAKDKSFNADMATHFDGNLHLVNVVPQDMGRVLLNLYTNAFYAVKQKQEKVGIAYKPMVEVTTTNQKDSVKISVKDNGAGMPENIKDKVLQPFFTTKPTGEGTGLGLSLSYDIVVKGHGGSIDINTKEGEGTEFVITLPV